MEKLDSKIILCQDIAGNTLRAISEENVKIFIKQLKDGIEFESSLSKLGREIVIREIDMLSGDALLGEGVK